MQKPGRWAYEVKFAISGEIAERVLAWAKSRMETDIHGEASYGGAYRIHTLYLDTPEHDVYLKSPGYRVSKFRVRQYGRAQTAFVEQKRKRGPKVMKRRTLVGIDEIAGLSCPVTTAVLPQDWFKIAIAERQLQPVSRVSYTRNAFNTMTPSGAVRLTVDHDVYACHEAEWKTGEVLKGLHLSPDVCIAEVKFPDALPQLFKELIRDFGLVQTGMSKFRMAHEGIADFPQVEDSRWKNS